MVGMGNSVRCNIITSGPQNQITTVQKYKKQVMSEIISKSKFYKVSCIRFINLRMLNFPTQMPFLLLCMVMCLQSFSISCFSHNQGLGIQVMNVGEELGRQILPLKMGHGVYMVHGLKECHWYEVKLSYPASIPARFSLQVKSNARDLWLDMNRRLLNTEKLIFKSDCNKSNSGDNWMYVLVTVEPEGFVAKPHVEESKFVLFNIVCDELLFGIPYKAWWVGTAAILCLMLASVVPYFFPLQRLLKIQASQSGYSTGTKSS